MLQEDNQYSILIIHCEPWCNRDVQKGPLQHMITVCKRGKQKDIRIVLEGEQAVTDLSKACAIVPSLTYTLKPLIANS